MRRRAAGVDRLRLVIVSLVKLILLQFACFTIKIQTEEVLFLINLKTNVKCKTRSEAFWLRDQKKEPPPGSFGFRMKTLTAERGIKCSGT